MLSTPIVVPELTTAFAKTTGTLAKYYVSCDCRSWMNDGREICSGGLQPVEHLSAIGVIANSNNERVYRMAPPTVDWTHDGKSQDFVSPERRVVVKKSKNSILVACENGIRDNLGMSAGTDNGNLHFNAAQMSNG